MIPGAGRCAGSEARGPWIAEALITTAAGLTVAISAIPAYNFFSAKTDQWVHDLERQATNLELLIQGRQRHEDPVAR